MSESQVTRVITTVHGTYARRATWVQRDSNLGRALAQRLGDNVLVVPFRWSGSNNPSARDEAQANLREHIKGLMLEHSSAKHYVIAHSHGGNVALYAMRDEAIRKEISGVICLATPFLISRPRSLAGGELKYHIVAAAVVQIAILVFLVRWLVNDWNSWWLQQAAILLAAIAVSIPLSLLVRKWHSFSDTLHKMQLHGTLPKEKVMIIRAPGDEASGLLLFFHFVSRLTVLVYSMLYLFHRWLVRLAGLLASWRIRLFGVLFAGTGITTLTAIVAIEMSQSTTTILTIVMVIGCICVVIPALLIMGWLEVVAMPGELLVGAMFTAVIVILSLMLLPFGWHVAVSNILLDVTAEPTPLGKWEVNQLASNGCQDQEMGDLSLQHSIVYDDPEALALICDWMDRT